VAEFLFDGALNLKRSRVLSSHAQPARDTSEHGVAKAPGNRTGPIEEWMVTGPETGKAEGMGRANSSGRRDAASA